jgi:hypothetical protein
MLGFLKLGVLVLTVCRMPSFFSGTKEMEDPTGPPEKPLMNYLDGLSVGLSGNGIFS